MKCPHCGSEMKNEQVFCEVCGKERLLVPVFEPEIEETVEQSMSDIVKEIDPDAANSDTAEEDKLNNTDSNTDASDNKKKSRLSGGSFWISVLVMVLIAICAFSIIFFIFYQNSFEYQMDRAWEAFNNKKYEEAIKFADSAIAIDEESLEPRLLKISVYEVLGETDTVIERCLAFLKRDPENEQIYRKLISIYIENEQYVALNSLLMDCPISSLVEEYREFTSFPPEFDMEEGEYDESISVKLLEIGNGSIFYTLDGSDVSEYSTRYEGPIKLESGEYIINAIYINTYGLVSKAVTRTYIINKSMDLDLQIEPDSGEYETPELIKINIPDENYTVYYNIGKKDPTLDSPTYTKPIFMPLGDNEIRFMMTDENGNQSDVVTRNYKLNIKSDYSKEDAIQQVTLNMVMRGEIIDGNGTMIGTTDVKEYHYDGVAADNEGRTFYLVSEFIKSEGSGAIRTGNTFAFSVSDGLIYKAKISDDSELSIEGF